MCKPQRNEPGCVVGEHEHFFLIELARRLITGWRGEAARDRLGDTGRSMEKRTDEEESCGGEVERLTRVGEDGLRLKKVEDLE